MVNILKKHW